MKIYGVFTIFSPKGKILQRLKNTVVNEGEAAFLKMLMRDDQTIVAGGDNFYIGLCGQNFSETTTLATLVGEPTTTSGYARQPVARSTAGWPTQDSVNNIARIRSAVVNFTASGGDFSTSIYRCFICNVVSGTAGTLFAVSAELSTPKQIVDGETFPVQYDLYAE